ncbi:MAG: hypothetical protein QOD74_994, partial [Variibacter sp.]|nr:hypothetical protein [Variibacter sp.]
CSALIAQAFQSVRYPILAKATRTQSRSARREILEIRHHSLYAPRDFDISPYFAVVKPTVQAGFDYKGLRWADAAQVADEAELPEGLAIPLFPDSAGAGAMPEPLTQAA